jgi:hypothetical protein
MKISGMLLSMGLFSLAAAPILAPLTKEINRDLIRLWHCA